jgi:hypothetical protein
LRTPEATPRRFDSGTNNAAKNSRPPSVGTSQTFAQGAGATDRLTTDSRFLLGERSR